MKKLSRLSSAARASLLWGASVSGLLLAACSSGGGSGGSLSLESVSVSGNGEWELNRPILFTFSEDVDFSSVNMNTIHIGQTEGGPALGEFSLVDPRTVKFQPRCPTLPDNSDAGLLPGGVRYTIQIPGAGNGSATVKSTSGGSLGAGLTVQFRTVTSSDPADLFIDTALGPPNPVIRTDSAVTDATYIEIGDDPANRVYFEPRTTPDPDRGAQVPAGFTAGLNLYSEVSSHVAIIVAINQAVDSSIENVNTHNIALQYRATGGNWVNLAHTVVLETNCLGTGARLRITPIGILPQNHLVRVILTRDFKDLVGDVNLVSIAVGTFLVSTATDPGTTTPGAAVDQILENFLTGGDSPGSLEDSSSVGADPPADWGTDGLLKAGFAFDGTGGPGGNFDWKIGNDQPPSASNHPLVLLDTSFSVILNEQQTAQQTVVNGLVDIRNLNVTASGTLSIQGPNPCTILISGSAVINGEINLKGNNNLSVATLNTTNQPEPGASGKAGGGRGGTGSYLTSQSTRVGGNGFGAFDVADGGGSGGESAFNPLYPNPDPDDGHRRPGGGGGGTLGHDFLRPKQIIGGYDNLNLCPDQGAVGYDAERGFSGDPHAVGALTGLTPPVGGAPGPRPFFNSDPNDDFWGTMLDTVSGQLIQGELLRPWAGAGGGAGGNAIVSNSFPTTPFDIGGDEKGSGAGGGGGSLTIYALGSITFGPHGRIIASGGTGGGGENSLGGDITHIGGGSGGGSGGHIILQTASQIDLRQISTDTTAGPAGGIYALGGNGGAGKNNLGGATPGGFPQTAQFDALPPNSYAPPTPVPCPVDSSAGYPFTNTVGNNPDVYPLVNGFPLVTICAGGDGGPGLIQFHTALLSDILVPNTGTPVETIYSVVKPSPVGSFPGSGAGNYLHINNPLTWNQMLPVFGRRSQGISKWIPLGAASVSPSGSAVPDPVQFYFKGTTAAGAIATTGSGSATVVAELTPILTGTIVDEQVPPVYPFVDHTDQRTIVFDAATLVDADDIYLRNVTLLKRFLLRVTHGTEVTDYEVAFASYDPATQILRLTVDAGGQPLGNVLPGFQVEVRPRFFRVLTDDVADSLPDSSQIVAEFQATLPNPQGDPDSSQVSAWVTDIADIDPNLNGNPDYKFFRFRVSFDISVNNAPLSFDTPIPSLDFFRIPFKF